MKKKTNVPAAAKIMAGKKVDDKKVMMKTGEGKAKSKKVMMEAKPGCKYPKGGI